MDGPEDQRDLVQEASLGVVASGSRKQLMVNELNIVSQPPASE